MNNARYTTSQATINKRIYRSAQSLVKQNSNSSATAACTNEGSVAQRPQTQPRHSSTDTIQKFHKAIAAGPTYVCCCCNQLWYRHSVQNVERTSLPNCQAVTTCLGNASADSWICNTCIKHLRSKKIPPCSIANGMSFPAIPEQLHGLHKLEVRLLSPRIPFMKIYEASRGGQYKVKGNVVNVPIDVVADSALVPPVTTSSAVTPYRNRSTQRQRLQIQPDSPRERSSSRTYQSDNTMVHTLNTILVSEVGLYNHRSPSHDCPKFGFRSPPLFSSLFWYQNVANIV